MSELNNEKQVGLLDRKECINQGKRLGLGNKRSVRIEISISGKRKEIHFSKDVVRLLGTPAYLCMKVNKERNSIAVMPCPGKEYMSFKVPNGIQFGKMVSMRVCSKPFVDLILAANGYKNDCTYQVSGVYSEKNNAVVFNMEDLRLYGDEAEDEGDGNAKESALHA